MTVPYFNDLEDMDYEDPRELFKNYSRDGYFKTLYKDFQKRRKEARER